MIARWLTRLRGWWYERDSDRQLSQQWRVLFARRGGPR
jgi:hypothetical protein